MSGAAFSDLQQTAGRNGANRGATGPSRPLREGPAPLNRMPTPARRSVPAAEARPHAPPKELRAHLKIRVDADRQNPQVPVTSGESRLGD